MHKNRIINDCLISISEGHVKGSTFFCLIFRMWIDVMFEAPEIDRPELCIFLCVQTRLRKIHAEKLTFFNVSLTWLLTFQLINSLTQKLKSWNFF